VPSVLSADNLAGNEVLRTVRRRRWASRVRLAARATLPSTGFLRFHCGAALGQTGLQEAVCTRAVLRPNPSRCPGLRFPAK